MEYVNIILKILGAFVTPVCTLIIGVMFDKLKQYKKESKEEKESFNAEWMAIKEVCKENLRLTLKQDYEQYNQMGYCPVEDKDEISRIYNLYHDILKGNGRGTLYYKSLMDLPNEKNG